MTKLQKKLKILGTITLYNWSVVRHIVENMDSIEVIESKWAEKFKRDHLDMYPLDLHKIRTWSTFEGCSTLIFKNLNSRFIECDAIIWNGDNLNGHRQNVRFTATLKIPIKFLSKIKQNIESKFEYHCENKYDKHLEDKKRRWIRSYEKKILE